jgi:hypothetical protein
MRIGGFLLGLACVGCSGTVGEMAGEMADGGSSDLAKDAGAETVNDAGASDAGSDAGMIDAGQIDAGPVGIMVAVSPQVATVKISQTLTLSATVTGTTNQTVTWSVLSSCGAVSSSGIFTAPATVPAGQICEVIAQSQQDPGKSGKARLTISPGSTGAPGVWEDVTPSTFMLDPGAANGNFGITEVLVDPVRPSDLYAFSNYQGVWRSTDYGRNWTRATPIGTPIDSGRQWAAAIDPDKLRDPTKPPTLYTTRGYGGNGLWRSTDWAVTWTEVSNPGDVYSIEIDPYDNQHLLIGFHETPGVAESTNGGVTFRSVSTVGMGNSIMAFFLDTGAAATTRTTWLAIPQTFSNGDTYRTSDSGGSWGMAGGFTHPHGTGQIFQAGAGVVYVAATEGIFRSANLAVSWSKVGDGNVGAVIGTPTKLYASQGVNFNSGPPTIVSAARNPGTAWTQMTVPAGLKHGAKRMAVTFDGTHPIVVAGSWMSGLWRYVEP